MTLKFLVHSSLLGLSNGLAFTVFQNKRGGKDQESTRSDPGHHMGKNKKAHENITHKRAKGSALSQTGDHKAAINRHHRRL